MARGDKVLPITSLKPASGTLQPRVHDARNIDDIADSMTELGAARSIAIDEEDVVLNGSGALAGAIRAGIKKVRIIEADGTELIAVRRRNLTPEQKRRLAVRDNRAAELAEWDRDVLKDLADAGELDGLWTPDELKRLLSAGDGDGDGDVEPLVVDQPQEVVWLLLGIPLERWPDLQDAIDTLQGIAKFSTSAIRPKERPAKSILAKPTTGRHDDQAQAVSEAEGQ